LIDTEKLEPEAPFGESNGYVALEAYNMPMRVTAITHKPQSGVSLDHQPGHAERVERHQESRLRAAVLSHLRDRLGIKGRARVVMPRTADQSASGDLRAARGRNPARSEVWRALHGAATLQSNCGKIVIAVSEDIDPLSMDAVLWSFAIAPIRSRTCISCHTAAAYRVRNTDPRLGFRHAGRCYPQISDGAARASHPRIHGACARAVGGARSLSAQRAIALARLRPGRLDRSLGDIRAPAATGDWSFSGADTLARQRGGLTPENPARFDDERKSRSNRFPTGAIQRWRGFPISTSRIWLLNSRTCCRAISTSIARWCTARTRCAPSARSDTSSGARACSIRDCGSWRSCRSAISRARLTNTRTTFEIGRHFRRPRRRHRAIAGETEGQPTTLEPLAKAVLRAARHMTNSLAIPEQTFAELRPEPGRRAA